MNIKSIEIWKLAFTFHFHNWKRLIPLFPFLFIPVFSDALHSLIIRHVINKEEYKNYKLIKNAKSLFLPLLLMKLYFWFKAVLWGFIPIIGIIKDFRYRMYWAMASNVAVFEGVFGKDGRTRCIELVDNDFSGIGARTFITIPGLLVMLCFIYLAIFSDVFRISLGFWMVIFAIYWISVPVSATVNTLYYLHLNKEEPIEGSEKIADIKEPEI